MSTGPLSTSVDRTDGKFDDLFHQGSGFTEAGLWSIGIPQKPSWCNTICIQLWCEVERAEIVLRSVGARKRGGIIDLELETHPFGESEGIL